MVFTPDAPFPKTRGHVIKSKDWNDAITEVQRLDTAKVNKEGDNVTGSLTIEDNLGIGTEDPQRQLQIGGDVSGIGGDVRGVGFSSSDVSPNAGYVRWGDNTGWKLHFGRSREGSGGALNTGTTGVLMTMQDNGNVGIGITTPGAKLDIDGDLSVSGDMRVGGDKTGYVVDNFINGVGDTLEQGDVLVIGSSDSSHYYGRNNSIPLIEGDLTDTAYDPRVCGIVDGVVTKDKLPLVEEMQASSLEDVAREVNATETAVQRAVKLGINPFELEGMEGTGSGGRVLVADVETAAEDGKVSSTNGLAEAIPEAFLNPLVKFAGEITPESDATKVKDRQMGKMVTLGAYAHCKVDADIAPISAGDLLTTSPTRGHAQKVLRPEKAAGVIVGKALASLDRDKGKIPVLVMLQ
jgi:hypothetical protein